MSWIETIEPENAAGELRSIYDGLLKSHGGVDEVMKVHSLRPATMAAHLSLYHSVLHNPENKVPRWLREAIGVLVSSLNGCTYCLNHHFEGMARALGDRVRAERIREALINQDFESFDMSQKEIASFRYAQRISLAPATATFSWIVELRDAGWSDGEILEINQVTAYFAYVNRVVVGLGCSFEGEALGRSPGHS